MFCNKSACTFSAATSQWQVQICRKSVCFKTIILVLMWNSWNRAVKFLSTCNKVAVALFDLPADVSFRENPMHIDNAYFRLKCKQRIFTYFFFQILLTWTKQIHIKINIQIWPLAITFHFHADSIYKLYKNSRDVI